MAIEEKLKNGSRFETNAEEDALGLLEREDVELGRLFTRGDEARGGTARGRALCGDLAKDIFQHMATREAALVEVARKVGEVPELEGIAANMQADPTARREILDRLEKMCRGVRASISTRVRISTVCSSS